MLFFTAIANCRFWPNTVKLSPPASGKYTFNLRGAKNILIKRVDDKQTLETFPVTINGIFLRIQLIHQEKSNRCLLKHKLPASFSVSFRKNHWSSTDKSIAFLEENIFPTMEWSKKRKDMRKSNTDW